MSDTPVLPPLIEVIRRHGLDPKRKLGQNFLLDPRLTAKIARATGPLDGVNVVEIGPGPGGLTRALLEGGAAQVVAVERDERCVAALQELAAAYPGRLTIQSADALEIDPSSLVPAPRRIIANLPYNVATPLLIGWLRNATAYDALGLMFQKEVAERLTAAPRTKAYGRLSILTQWLAEADMVFDIPPGAFYPPPKITSTVVQLIPRKQPLAEARIEDLERVTASAFGQRRKMLRVSLKTLGVDTDRLIELAGVTPTARAEELDVIEFCALARALASFSERGAGEQ
ncbi:MAG TPA: 16S rRNA (adenine(1518)-N(6)/adenine(1519)-N(6))-dimethyltransferase RsmA [Aliidongia sp.]|uniref:16S rRNA (adenine(1518)-N(6)/adenine(1519)-N(6))- dimethyltransferase RsmA n=1 Tax=Aliidongia sp. TaxID=1914230 RepID=UPI002DDC9455|nr:16S rRNA (adenine(1518)-N(6)/adenine(1519)-N(6))-dimethyltransferase RsmA [Aliidongia sp.]HEV2675931.1 16S rRNA (adenine(1518)-N(6)/adenine(1519)-N(6))-dimethyltransferase RsmA [Aliidongia sp.]